MSNRVRIRRTGRTRRIKIVKDLVAYLIILIFLIFFFPVFWIEKPRSNYRPRGISILVYIPQKRDFL